MGKFVICLVRWQEPKDLTPEALGTWSGLFVPVRFSA